MVEVNRHLQLVEPDTESPEKTEGLVRVRFEKVHALAGLLRKNPQAGVLFQKLEFPVGRTSYEVQAAASATPDKTVLGTWIGWFNPPEDFRDEIEASVERGEDMPTVSIGKRTLTVASRFPTAVSGMELKARLTKHTAAVSRALEVAIRRTGQKLDVVLKAKPPRTSPPFPSLIKNC
jgi:hypothetical protein